MPKSANGLLLVCWLPTPKEGLQSRWDEEICLQIPRRAARAALISGIALGARSSAGWTVGRQRNQLGGLQPGAGAGGGGGEIHDIKVVCVKLSYL